MDNFYWIETLGDQSIKSSFCGWNIGSEREVAFVFQADWLAMAKLESEINLFWFIDYEV